VRQFFKLSAAPVAALSTLTFVAIAAPASAHTYEYCSTADGRSRRQADIADPTVDVGVKPAIQSLGTANNFNEPSAAQTFDAHQCFFWAGHCRHLDLDDASAVGESGLI
jgi:hypothetical protein